MENPAKLVPVLQYLEKSKEGAPGMSAKTLKEAADDLITVLNRTFNIPRNRSFRLRMSNIGKPYCQLWMEKNKPDAAIPLNPADIIKFTIGDITEIVVKAILKEVFKDEYTDSRRHSLNVGGKEIQGESDLRITGAVDDVKSAADWSYKHKFKDVQALAESDHFGYITQLVAYAKSEDEDIGGWWVVNKTTGEFKYVEASSLTEEQIKKIWDDVEENIRRLEANEPFEKMFSDEPETFRKKETGNRILPRGTPCRFCQFRNSCWPTLTERPSLVSQAKVKGIEYYTKIDDGYLSE